jgi:S-adenosylmethionine hydrolase
MAPTYNTVTFLSDYGLVDEFVGIVHSVIRSLAPEAQVIDLTHQIPPYDVRAGGLALARSAPYLCPGVVLAVVDPGVGTARRGVAVEVGDGASVLVGPDNGLLAPAVAMCGGPTTIVELTNAEYQLETPGATFAGRDVFAPAAAHLCCGVPLTDLGPVVEPTSLMPGLLPVARHEQEALIAEVLWVDQFGNAQLNVDVDDVEPLGERVRVQVGDRSRSARRLTAYADIAVGEVGLVIDSYGLVSVAVDRRSAASELGLHPGTEVRLESYDADDDDDDDRHEVTSPVSLGTKDGSR